MYKDIHRLQDALIPALLEKTCLVIIRAEPKYTKTYIRLVELCHDFVDSCFSGLPKSYKKRLYQELSNKVSVVDKYAYTNNLCCYVMLHILIKWCFALMDAGGVVVPEKTELFAELVDLKKEIENERVGGEPLEVEYLAAEHGTKINKLLRLKGCFV